MLFAIINDKILSFSLSTWLSSLLLENVLPSLAAPLCFNKEITNELYKITLSLASLMCVMLKRNVPFIYYIILPSAEKLF